MTKATKPTKAVKSPAKPSKAPKDTAESKAAKELEKTVQQLAVECVQSNTAKNYAENQYKKQRSALLSLMKKEKIHDFDFDTSINGVRGVVDVFVDRSSVVSIDVPALLKKISMAEFLKIAKVTKGDVESLLGKEAAEELTIVKEGTENVTVKFTSADKVRD